MKQPSNLAGAGDDQTNQRLRLLGMVLLPLTIFPLLSFFTYSWRDISLLQSPPESPPANLIGMAGAWAAFTAYSLFGLAARLAPFLFLLLCLALIAGRVRRLVVSALWLIPAIAGYCGWLQLRAAEYAGVCGPEGLNIAPNAGGAVGYLLTNLLLEPWLGNIGAGILLVIMMVTGLTIAIGFSTIEAAAVRSASFARRCWTGAFGGLADKRKERRPAAPTGVGTGRTTPVRRSGPVDEPEVVAPPRDKYAAATTVEPPRGTDPAGPVPRSSEEGPEEEETSHLPQDNTDSPYEMPSLDLLDPEPAAGQVPGGETGAMAGVIRDTLSDFGLQVEITHVERGPVVTRYELLPAPGIRVERIAALANTLGLTLKATSVRVQAPIPGKGVVGIEVPNEKAQVVTARQILSGSAWAASKAEIPLILGKDVGGNDLVLDLARIPHLLIAGATGSGKSVCINAMLAGLLMSRAPRQLRLMLIDPKIVEFAVFAELPHLVAPVITDPKKVSLGLRWAIVEMERRYKLLARAGVRNVAAYNRRQVVIQDDMFDSGAAEPANEDLPDRLPYIVIVIDELADLMLTAGPEIENSVARLAQLSRAVGIHMILATQRPSVNVITGTIKANFPGRVAFQVAQKVDSRTILDAGGAETLIGSGDMLFLNPWTSKLIRAQGALIKDHEIKRLVDFIRDQTQPVYVEEVCARTDAADDQSGEQDFDFVETGDDEDEPLLEQAVAIIRETRRASTSSLQRRLRIGYNRAARLMDALEQRGVVGPPRGSDPREILVDLDPGMPDTEEDAGEDDMMPDQA